MKILPELPDIESRCIALIEELGLGRADEVVAVVPLTGGVASDIARVELGSRQFCVKFALGKLRVAASWHAPVHRNRAEYAWLGFAQSVKHGCAPGLHGCSETLHGFAMDYLSGGDVYLWKSAMLEGASHGEESAGVAAVLGSIHAASAQPAFDRSPFENRDDFLAIRLEPYLSFTSTRHACIAERLNELASRFHKADIALVHGDVSPKNILIRSGTPVFLDAECATMGDPAFDVAFCLNHLIIKALHLPASRNALLKSVPVFWNAYAAQVSWEDAGAVGARVAELIPALMLGRVDGKSPVEYLNDEERHTLRTIAIPLIADPPGSVEDLVELLRQALKR
jgi:Phosphotransferase enzyme family